jgi:hypothetical protein
VCPNPRVHSGPYGSLEKLAELDYYKCPACGLVIKDRYGKGKQ